MPQLAAALAVPCLRRRTFVIGGAQTTAKARWWIQDPFNAYYQSAARAIEKHWKVRPNFVCEGGTLRVTPFLEEVCAVRACAFSSFEARGPS